MDLPAFKVCSTEVLVLRSSTPLTFLFSFLLQDMIAKTVNESIKFYMVDPKSWIYEFGGGPRQPAAASAPNVVPAKAEETAKVPLKPDPLPTTKPPAEPSAPSPRPDSAPARQSSASQLSASSSSTNPDIKLSPRNTDPSMSVPSESQAAPAPSTPREPARTPSAAPAKKAQGQFSSLLRSLEGVDPEEDAELRRVAKKKQHQQPAPRPKPRKQSLTEDDSEFVVVKPPEVDGTLRVRIVEAVELAGGEVFACDPCT
jgi:hypothetical protein